MRRILEDSGNGICLQQNRVFSASKARHEKRSYNLFPDGLRSCEVPELSHGHGQLGERQRPPVEPIGEALGHA
jgi:hypothetical protein